MSRRRPYGVASTATPGRVAALDITRRVRENDARVSDVAATVLDPLALPVEEKGFATLLSIGVVSTWGTLDELIDSVLRTPKDVACDVRDALRISVYELIFLHKSEHAAVDQGVELVRFVSPRATGLANFVLRRIVELGATFPFGDPQTDFAAAARLHAFPEWLALLFKKDLGKRNALLLMDTANHPAPIWFMISRTRVDGKRVLDSLVARGIKMEPVASLVPEQAAFTTFRLLDRSDIGDELVRRLLQEGVLVVSDLSAQSIVSLALPERMPKRFLEIGSGRGSKTIMLQDGALGKYGEQMPLETVEVSAAKNELLVDRISRAGARCECSHILDATDLSSLAVESFDAVFIDAPCTGVGTLRRHPEIRWRLKPRDIEVLADLGFEMLVQASRLVAHGGRLSYATCSVFEAENAKVIRRFLKSKAGAGFEIVAVGHKGFDYFKSPIVQDGPDVHFCAVLRRCS